MNTGKSKESWIEQDEEEKEECQCECHGYPGGLEHDKTCCPEMNGILEDKYKK